MNAVQVRSLVLTALLLVTGISHGQTKPPDAAGAASPKPTNKTTTVDADPAASSGPASVEEPDTEAWSSDLYGFLEFDAMRDTTQSYGPASNNALIARPGSYAATHTRAQLTVNNSLLGLRLAAPEYHHMKLAAQGEIDFFGVPATDTTEQNLFTAPSVRLRLFYAKLENPIVDVLVGQYHDLFGWGGHGFYPNTVAFLGVPGEVYHRNPQFRLSKEIGNASSAAQLSIAAAAVRPAQRDAGVPDVQAGIKLAINPWKGAGSQGFGQPQALPLAIGVSGVSRQFSVADFATAPGDAKDATGWGLAANAFVPVIPVTSAEQRGNGLSLTGEFSMGTGISDLYTGLTAGALFPLLPDPTGSMTPPPVYRPNIDQGIVTYDGNGNLQTIDWRGFVVGLQYYLPIDDGRVWISATYSQLESENLLEVTPEAARGGVFFKQQYFDANLFTSVTPAAQVGVSYQFGQQTYGDLPLGGTHPKAENHRGELGARVFF